MSGAPQERPWHMDAIDLILRSNDLVAVLGRQVSVRLVDISASGCLLECDSRLPEGTTGSLRVAVDGVEYVDDVRVMRCGRVEGASAGFQIGAEFLWTSSPGSGSLRRVVTLMQNGAAKLPGLGRIQRM